MCNELDRIGFLSGFFIMCIVFMVQKIANIAFIKVIIKNINKDIYVYVIRKLFLFSCS